MSDKKSGVPLGNGVEAGYQAPTGDGDAAASKPFGTRMAFDGYPVSFKKATSVTPPTGGSGVQPPPPPKESK